MRPSDVKIAVVFNEHIESCGDYHSTSEILYSLNPEGLIETTTELVDLSEVGVIEERLQVEAALKEKGFQTQSFNINNDIQSLVSFLSEEKPKLVFNLCESLFGKAIHEMHVAGVFELMNVYYTGSPSITLGACLNKVWTKEILKHYDIPVARHQVYESKDQLKNKNFKLSFPVIVKPLGEDASAGIENESVVSDFKNLVSRVTKILTIFNQPALVEEYIDGREINVAILGNTPPKVLPLSEIDFSGLPSEYPKIVTFNAKWLEGSLEYSGTVGKCPAILPRSVEEKIKRIALCAYSVMGVRDYARVDIRLDKNNTPYVLEINPNPDISRDAGFIRSAKVAGMTFEDVMEAIVQCALMRCKV
ncbi:MAG: ATP-grasp domain-containing protein [Bacteroidetes bacterium]|nr:ATP-grasp domain-containing protein [Bacteroidota bacterium]